MSMTMEGFMGSLLFAILVLFGFSFWLASSIPNLRVPEWSGRACFFLAAVVWFLGRLA